MAFRLLHAFWTHPFAKRGCKSAQSRAGLPSSSGGAPTGAPPFSALRIMWRESASTLRKRKDLRRHKVGAGLFLLSLNSTDAHGTVAVYEVEGWVHDGRESVHTKTPTREVHFYQEGSCLPLEQFLEFNIAHNRSTRKMCQSATLDWKLRSASLREPE